MDMLFYEDRRRQIGFTAGYMLVSMIIIGFLIYGQYRAYTVNYNRSLERLCVRIREQYPDVAGADIMKILSGEDDGQEAESFFAQYGVQLTKNSVLLENDRAMHRFVLLDVTVFAVLLLGLVCYLRLQSRYFSGQTKQMAQYLQNINAGNYELNMSDSTEGQMAILKSEIYKTAIMMREQAENAMKDKLLVKNSLSDISHQLKTPLTSLSINMENLARNPQMDRNKQQDIIRRSRRDINNVNYMVQAILKLSRLEADVVEFTKETVKLSEIVDCATEDVMALCDLKGIEIIIDPASDQDVQIVCDRYWQTQAITNIVKNAVEHAKTRVEIRYVSCELYQELVIDNDGEAIREADRVHLFKRFYRGTNATADSVGIGLALAQTIIEHDGGYITADHMEYDSVTEQAVGTRFVVRYFQHRNV